MTDLAFPERYGPVRRRRGDRRLQRRWRAGYLRTLGPTRIRGARSLLRKPDGPAKALDRRAAARRDQPSRRLWSAGHGPQRRANPAARTPHSPVDPQPLHFGLGTAISVDEIRVRWPSGIVQTLHGAEVDRVIKIAEPIECRVETDYPEPGQSILECPAPVSVKQKVRSARFPDKPICRP